MNTTQDRLRDELTATGIAQIVESVIPRIACELRLDMQKALEAASAKTRDERERMVIEQLIANARIAAEKRVPLCQDTGSVRVLLEVGIRDSSGAGIAVPSDIFSLVDEAVARAYSASGLRMSMVHDAFCDRSNTNDNTPAFCELYFNPQKIGASLHVMLKGGGSDNASRVVMLPPGVGIKGVKQAVLQTVIEKGAGACPPLVIGVGVGSTFDKVGTLAKRALLRPLGESAPDERLAAFEQELLEEVNDLGIGAGGFGGAITALAVAVQTAPCHIASLPVAVNMGCNSLRSISVDLEAAADSNPGAFIEHDISGMPEAPVAPAESSASAISLSSGGEL